MKKVIIALLGLTASGKTKVAEELMNQNDRLCMLNCDSMQIYRGIDIGTSKPLFRKDFKGRYFLFDIVDPGEEFNAYVYQKLAEDIVNRLFQNGRIPIFVGGTGFYFRAFEYGLVETPSPDKRLREVLLQIEMERSGFLWMMLNRLDPDCAKRLHKNDLVRIQRAIEYILKEGKQFSRLLAGHKKIRRNNIKKFIFFPKKEVLLKRITQRTEWMFHNGLIEETRRLLENGYKKWLLKKGIIGYKEAIGVIESRMSIEEAIRHTIKSTLEYARRQRVWFKREDGVFLEGDDILDNLRRIKEDCSNII